MTVFEHALHDTLGVEGDFSDHSSDSGGKTRFGITEAVARAHGYTGSMRELPPDLAQTIYRADYWDKMHLEEVSEISERVARKLFDSAVNVGTERAGRWFQRALNVLNGQGRHYADIVEDGNLGPNTVDAFRAYSAKRRRSGESVMLKALSALQGNFYIELAERRQKDEDFIFGWLRTRM